MSPATRTGPGTTAFRIGRLSSQLYLPGFTYRDARLGYIGNLAEVGETNMIGVIDGGKAGERAEDSPASAGSRAAFLRAAKNKLFGMGADKIIGPVDGDTWHRYRLPLEGFAGPNFLEPNYYPFTQDDFMAAGLSVIATYHTSVVEDLTAARQKLTEAATPDQKTISTDIKIRCLNLDDFENELIILHRFSLEAFKKNFLFSAIELASFQALYSPIIGRLRKELALIAEDNRGTALAFVLAVPDPKDRATVVVKTLARHTSSPRGLGRYLFYEVLARAHQLGYQRAECALIKDDNFSASLPDQIGGKILRRFALFGSE